MALFATLMLMVSIGAVSIAHAVEPVASIGEHTAHLLGHEAGDADEVPADIDKSYPHHHSACHDHMVDVTGAIATPAGCDRMVARLLPGSDETLPDAASDAPRRPPRA
ncbi:hypothetical protein [Novosphingobium sp. Rr 2-17]|uniref:hypothetical protein n=1 Tax=Novosphingobium sp. Rr 2-17 TaxID=555793 RepID=UPI0012F6CC68|nr:hypothetical protein [Novosphingobium sp. Rr 2-17]